MLTLTVEQMRRVEAAADRAGISYARLMDNAGTMAYNYLERRYGLTGKRCLILAGAGNNGGDGFVIARRIAEAGGQPTVLLCCGQPTSPLAAENYARLPELGIPLLDWAAEPERAGEAIASAQIIVDGIFGTGFHGEVTGAAADVIGRANGSAGHRVALDVPSGMNADTGVAGGLCFHAELTLSFAACKPAHGDPDCRAFCGEVAVLDIGIPEEVLFSAIRRVTEIDADMLRQRLPVRPPESHKGDYGRLLNIAGSARMGGAAMMCTLAAMRTGAGITTLATPLSVSRRISDGLMEAMTLPLAEAPDGGLSTEALPDLVHAGERATACLIGCGLSVTPNTKQIVEYAIKNTNCTLILDADALNCIRSKPELLREARHTPVITPHIGEMARLVDLTPEQVAANAVTVAQLFAREYQTVVVLKDHRTLVAAPTGELFRNTTGNAGLAKGGSGDVLAGMLAAFAAQGLSGVDAAVCAVYLHGLCADRLAKNMSQYSLLARDIIAEIPLALRSLGR